MGKGFTGFYHYGHTCFVRQDYEAVHLDDDELSRLEDALGMSFSGINIAMYYCLVHAKHLLYRLESDEIDNELLRGRDPWVPFRDGWVHIVTGEYVPDAIKPSRDSYPCWKVGEPAELYFDSYSAVQMSGWMGTCAILLGCLAELLGGIKNARK